MAYLVSPGFPAEGALGAWFGLGSAASNAQAPLGALLMALAGLAWGLYSLRGRTARDPLADTAASFARALPLALALSLATLPAFEITARGAWLAVISGGLASGLGYVVWYAALRGLTTTRAAIVQLCVPVLAAIGGVLLLSETVTPRLLLATVLVLGGIALAIAGRDTVLRVRR
jgi:drug/metabolite transporter (DMT)-like permease